MIRMRFLEKPWVTVGGWSCTFFLFFFSINRMHGCGALREKGLHYPNGPETDRTDTQRLRLNHRSPQGAPGTKDLRPTCHPRSQCPTVAQTMGVSHRRGGVALGGGESPPCIMVVMPTASSYVPFHITQGLVNVAGRC